MRINDLARALSELDLVPMEPSIAEIGGCDYENNVFGLKRSILTGPYFRHYFTDVCIMRSWTKPHYGAALFVNRMIKRRMRWREIFAECEQSIGIGAPKQKHE